MTDPVVVRLHRCLVDALRRRGRPPGQAPIKVSEIYQELVPYREVRGVLGVNLNADYEHALMRLLAGEGRLLRLEPETAQQELRQEAEAPYPSVGLYRKFAAADAWIVADAPDVPDGAGLPEPVVVGQHPGAVPEQEPPVPRSRSAAVQQSPGPAAEPAPAPLAARFGSRVAAARDAGADRRVVARAAECAFCDQPLPVGRRVRYCPSCGSDQRLRPCPRCDEVLERTWRFCVNCGLEVPVVPTPRPPDPDE